MDNASDDIRVGAVRLPWLESKRGWLLPWGETISNPFAANRLAEELNDKRKTENE